MRVLALLVIALLSSGIILSHTYESFAETVSPLNIDIPLSEIWALNMPGTKPMNRTLRGTPLAYEAPEGALVAEIASTLHAAPRRNTAGECFAVEGRGMVALRAAYEVLVKGTAKQSNFRKGQQISLVFYSLPFNAYVHLVQAEQRAETIQLRYRFVQHETREMTVHLALVPLFPTKSKQSKVKVNPSADDGMADFDRTRWGKKIVCSSFELSSSINEEIIGGTR